jgi:hypothetical protein
MEDYKRQKKMQTKKSSNEVKEQEHKQKQRENKQKKENNNLSKIKESDLELNLSSGEEEEIGGRKSSTKVPSNNADSFSSHLSDNPESELPSNGSRNLRGLIILRAECCELCDFKATNDFLMSNHLKEKHYLQDNQEINHSSTFAEKVKSFKQSDKTQEHVVNKKVQENVNENLAASKTIETKANSLATEKNTEWTKNTEINKLKARGIESVKNTSDKTGDIVALKRKPTTKTSLSNLNIASEKPTFDPNKIVQLKGLIALKGKSCPFCKFISSDEKHFTSHIKENHNESEIKQIVSKDNTIDGKREENKSELTKDPIKQSINLIDRSNDPEQIVDDCELEMQSIPQKLVNLKRSEKDDNTSDSSNRADKQLENKIVLLKGVVILTAISCPHCIFKTTKKDALDSHIEEKHLLDNIELEHRSKKLSNERSDVNQSNKSQPITKENNHYINKDKQQSVIEENMEQAVHNHYINDLEMGESVEISTSNFEPWEENDDEGSFELHLSLDELNDSQNTFKCDISTLENYSKFHPMKSTKKNHFRDQPSFEYSEGNLNLHLNVEESSNEPQNTNTNVTSTPTVASKLNSSQIKVNSVNKVSKENNNSKVLNEMNIEQHSDEEEVPNEEEEVANEEEEVTNEEEEVANEEEEVLNEEESLSLNFKPWDDYDDEENIDLNLSLTKTKAKESQKAKEIAKEIFETANDENLSTKSKSNAKRSKTSNKENGFNDDVRLEEEELLRKKKEEEEKMSKKKTNEKILNTSSLEPWEEDSDNNDSDVSKEDLELNKNESNNKSNRNKTSKSSLDEEATLEPWDEEPEDFEPNVSKELTENELSDKTIGNKITEKGNTIVDNRVSDELKSKSNANNGSSEANRDSSERSKDCSALEPWEDEGESMNVNVSQEEHLESEQSTRKTNESEINKESTLEPWDEVEDLDLGVEERPKTKAVTSNNKNEASKSRKSSAEKGFGTSAASLNKSTSNDEPLFEPWDDVEDEGFVPLAETEKRSKDMLNHSKSKASKLNGSIGQSNSDKKTQKKPPPAKKRSRNTLEDIVSSFLSKQKQVTKENRRQSIDNQKKNPDLERSKCKTASNVNKDKSNVEIEKTKSKFSNSNKENFNPETEKSKPSKVNTERSNAELEKSKPKPSNRNKENLKAEIEKSKTKSLVVKETKQTSNENKEEKEKRFDSTKNREILEKSNLSSMIDDWDLDDDDDDNAEIENVSNCKTKTSKSDEQQQPKATKDIIAEIGQKIRRYNPAATTEKRSSEKTRGKKNNILELFFYILFCLLDFTNLLTLRLKSNNSST